MAWNIWSKKRQKDLWGDMDKSIGMQEFYNKSFSERGQAGKKNNLLKKKISNAWVKNWDAETSAWATEQVSTISKDFKMTRFILWWQKKKKKERKLENQHIIKKSAYILRQVFNSVAPPPPNLNKYTAFFQNLWK